MHASEPLIVTAWLEDAALDWFNDLRRQHFPVDRNHVPAHLTLFHALPAAHEREIAETLKAACTRTAPLSATVRAPWSLGRGVAYRLEAPELAALRATLAEAFMPWLTAQDRAPWRPHITVQNKVEPAEARALLADLQHAFEPFRFGLEGLLVWRYLGGPWAPVARLPFAARTPS